MKHILIPALCAGLFLSACKNESKTEKNTKTDTTASVVTPGSNTNVITNPSPVVNPNNANTNAVIGMNPEHGKPGHRCDIPVGAPLNTPPPNNAVTNTTNSPTISTSPTVQTTTTPTTVAPGMNPAHGQPGHRCDIPVGSPLNSKPAPAATTVPVKTN